MVEIQGSQPIPKGELLLASTSLLFVPPIFSISKNILSTLYCGIIFPLVGMKKKLHNGSMILLYKGLQKKKKQNTILLCICQWNYVFVEFNGGKKNIYNKNMIRVFVVYILYNGIMLLLYLFFSPLLNSMEIQFCVTKYPCKNVILLW